MSHDAPESPLTPADLKEDPVRRLFTRITPRYDVLNRLLSFGLDRFWRRRAAEAAALEPGGNAVDLCCGTGALTILLANLAGFYGQVIGADFVDGMLDRARRKYSVERYPQLHFIAANARALPLDDASMDAATIAFGLRNVGDLDQTFKEMVRVVRPGGRLVSLELTRPAAGWLRTAHTAYLRWALPAVGGLLSGSSEAYKYLGDTIEGFLDPEIIAVRMEAAGWGTVRIIPLSGGIATLHVGVKA